MLIHQQLKQELLNTIDQFCINKKPTDKATILLVLDIKGIIDNATAGSQLVTEVKQRVVKLSYRVFGFLPGVNDIRRSIEAVFKKKEYKLIYLLVEENQYIRQENFDLKQELKAIKKSNKYLEPSDLLVSLEQANEKINSLGTQLQQKVEQITLLRMENEELCKAVHNQDQDKLHLQQELTDAKAKIEKITELYDAATAQNAELIEKLHALHELIGRNAKPESRTYRKSLVIN